MIILYFYHKLVAMLIRELKEILQDLTDKFLSTFFLKFSEISATYTVSLFKYFILKS